MIAALGLRDRLLAAGYTQDQADAVVGVTRIATKSCGTCELALELDPECERCTRNPYLRDEWKGRGA